MSGSGSGPPGFHSPNDRWAGCVEDHPRAPSGHAVFSPFRSSALFFHSSAAPGCCRLVECMEVFSHSRFCPCSSLLLCPWLFQSNLCVPPDAASTSTSSSPSWRRLRPDGTFSNLRSNATVQECLQLPLLGIMRVQPFLSQDRMISHGNKQETCKCSPLQVTGRLGFSLLSRPSDARTFSRVLPTCRSYWRVLPAFILLEI